MAVQNRKTLDQAFHVFFEVCDNVLTEYQNCYRPDLSEVSKSSLDPKSVEEGLKNYKSKYDNSASPDVFVDVALELYDRIRLPLLKGYYCDSWLQEPECCLFFGSTLESARGRVIQLKDLYSMINYMKRQGEKYKENSFVLRCRFAHSLYRLFGEVVKADLTQKRKDDLSKLEECATEVLTDLPKKAPPPPANAGGGLMEMFGSLKNSLPDLARSVSEAVKKNMPKDMTSEDQDMINSAIENISSLVSNPSGLQDMLAGMQSGGKLNIDKMVEKLVSGVMPKSSPPTKKSMKSLVEMKKEQGEQCADPDDSASRNQQTVQKLEKSASSDKVESTGSDKVQPASSVEVASSEKVEVASSDKAEATSSEKMGSSEKMEDHCACPQDKS
jgi:hypothetical protein